MYRIACKHSRKNLRVNEMRADRIRLLQVLQKINRRLETSQTHAADTRTQKKFAERKPLGRQKKHKDNFNKFFNKPVK